MGEVYRADDLTLGQPVALKFLPDQLAEDPGRLDRFYSEVRLARQVSHPNVCRIYDIGKESGRHFLSMEYIDGEDLASLLRRIGRLPQDKGLEMARQLCAGLAAAHERGVLHRDLKPANVMIDGRGKVRIADFGLARSTEDLHDPRVLEGTPAYMAPEQFAGAGESVKSDLYSLGLVLYEMFTGKAAFKAASTAELIRHHRETNPTNPTTIITDLDPAIERVILRCLEKDPALRPSTALAVSAALPGGDPLAAALAAGETPSPEIVAAAGDMEGLSPRLAWAALAVILLGMVAVMLLADKASLFSMIPQMRRPEALAERGRELISKLGYSAEPRDRAYGYMGTDFLRHLGSKVSGPDQWEQVRIGEPPAFVFWYRESPRLLTQTDFQLDGQILPTSPPQQVPGMVGIQLDPAGRLIRFDAVPPQLEPADSGEKKADWHAIFGEAGLDLANFKPVSSKYVARVYAQSRLAWDGTYPRRSDIPIHVEAASAFGRLVYFQIFEPWGLPETVDPSASVGVRIAGVARSFMLGGVLAGALFLAWRNLRLNRVDRRGAFRISAFVFVSNTAAYVLRAHFVPDFYEISGLLFLIVCDTLMNAMLIWIGYVALEPQVRRWWPHTIISWERLLSGHFRDPKIGRDLLLGGIFGVIMVLLKELSYIVPIRLHLPSGPTMGGSIEAAMGISNLVGRLAQQMANTLVNAFLIFLALFLLRLILKKQWLAAAVLIGFVIMSSAATSVNPLVGGFLGMLVGGTLVFLFLRFGLVAAIAFTIFNNISNYVPITSDLSRWYATSSVMVLVLAAALAVFGFRTALAGKPAFNLDL